MPPGELPTMLVGQRSRHRIGPFRLHRPTREADAVALFAASAGEASYMSGGIDLINRMKSGCDIDDVIHLGAIPDRSSIDLSGGDLSIGAGVTHDAIAKSRLIRGCVPSLCDAWSSVANIRVRMKGTVGGNLMARELSHDFPIVAIALGATFEFMTATSGLKQTDAASLDRTGKSDLLTRIRIPQVATQSMALELRWKPHLAFSLSFLHEGNYVRRIRLSAGSGFDRFCCSNIHLDTPLTATLIQSRSSEFADRLVSDLPKSAEDWIATANYRRRLLITLVGRKLAVLGAQGASSNG
jgi:aerobic carbon-monoxide dehydrogenase medium subunit